MTDPTLADLRVLEYATGELGLAVVDSRKTTPQDLSAVLASLTDEQLAEMGGERLEAIETSPISGHVPVRNPGTYLVVPIPEDS